MHKAAIALAAVLLSTFALQLQAQSTSPGHAPAGRVQESPDPLPAPHYRPKLALQDALKIAEGYIDREHIDISSYWLYTAHWILVGDKNTRDEDKFPCWHFLWVNDNGALGDYVEIMVTMDGKASRAPSM